MKKYFLSSNLILILFCCIGCDNSTPETDSTKTNQNKTAMIKAPVADKIPTQLTAHGETRIDNYFWN